MIFADDNSALRRAAERETAENERRERRRREILDTLRRCKAEGADPALLAARDRARRHAALMEQYPPLW
jgi:hypothetical protein